MTQMIEVKTAEIIGPALDWAVDAIESGKPLEIRHHKNGSGEWIFVADGVPYPSGPRKFSTDWNQGGPLIEKHRVSTEAPGVSSGFWTASMPGSALMGVCQGPTPLVAGCRRLVREHLGDVVQVPKELLP